MGLIQKSQEDNVYRATKLNANEGILTPSIKGWILVPLGKTFKLGSSEWKILKDTGKRNVCYMATLVATRGVEVNIVLKVEQPFFRCEVTTAEEGYQIGQRLELEGSLVASLMVQQKTHSCFFLTFRELFLKK